MTPTSPQRRHDEVREVGLAPVDPDEMPRARRAPRRPWGLARSHWHRLPQDYRRDHYYCCLLPSSRFCMEDVEHGRRDGWWLKAQPA